MSDDIQTFFEGARLVSQKKFHNTNQVHTQYIHLHSDSKIGTYFLAWFCGSFFDKLLRNNMKSLHFL